MCNVQSTAAGNARPCYVTAKKEHACKWSSCAENLEKHNYRSGARCRDLGRTFSSSLQNATAESRPADARQVQVGGRALQSWAQSQGKQAPLAAEPGSHDDSGTPSPNQWAYKPIPETLSVNLKQHHCHVPKTTSDTLPHTLCSLQRLRSSSSATLLPCPCWAIGGFAAASPAVQWQEKYRKKQLTNTKHLPTFENAIPGSVAVVGVVQGFGQTRATRMERDMKQNHKTKFTRGMRLCELEGTTAARWGVAAWAKMATVKVKNIW